MATSVDSPGPSTATATCSSSLAAPVVRQVIFSPQRVAKERSLQAQARKRLATGDVTCTASDFFNMLPDNLLTFDCRDAEAYERGHIGNAVRFLPDPSDRTISYPDVTPAFADTVLLYGDACSVDVMRQCRDYIKCDLAHRNPAEPIRRVLQLECDFDAFASAYPFMVHTHTQYNPAARYPAEILPNELYLGPAATAADPHVFANLPIRLVLNCTVDVPCYFEDAPPGAGEAPPLRYARVPLEDSLSADLTSTLGDALAFLSQARRGAAVLVHCQQGVSRSVAVTLAYLMATRGMRYDAALRWVTRCRWLACPNENFELQLRDVEGELGQLLASVAHGEPA